MNRIFSYLNLKVVVVLGIILAMLITLVAVNKVSASEHGTRQKLITSVIVEQGDTLWDIAQKYYSDEYESMDDYIEDIMAVNNISSTVIVEGNNIIIPYYE